MDKKRLEYYKKKLATRREELMKTIARTQEEGRTADEDPTVDLADKAANSYTKEFLFGMTNTDRTILNMIDAALKRGRLNALIRRVEKPQGEWRSDGITRAPEIGADNGSEVTNSPEGRLGLTVGDQSSSIPRVTRSLEVPGVVNRRAGFGSQD
jgi:hypothetical protein